MASDLTIVVRLSGGLGNQLHQYAYGYFLSKKYKGKLCIDTSFFDLDSNQLKITSRKYELGNLMVEAERFKFFLSNYISLRLVLKFSFLKKLLYKFLKIQIAEARLEDKEMQGGEKLLYTLGVFGTANEYLQIAADLKEQFYPKPEILNLLPAIKDLKETNTVAIHVRRSDYLNTESVHEVMPLSYYLYAIEFIKTKVSDPVFYLFGDDEKWITENFDLTNRQFRLTNFSGDLAHLADFFAMRSCHHCIISNSTFAWWAAFLNPRQDKIIVAPSKWLKGNAVNIEETYLTNWHVI